jgi:hypothetical protein
VKPASVFILALLVFAACGDDRSSMPPPPSSGGIPGAIPGGAAPGAEAPDDTNPKFTILKPYFKDFLRRPLDSKVNIFRTNLDRFTPTVEIDADPEQADESPKTPLEYYDVHSYKLVLIMSGTAQAKALVIDPRDKSYIVQVGTLIGNRAGKVTSISATAVTIDEPGYAPIVKTLESPIDEMERELQAVQEF